MGWPLLCLRRRPSWGLRLVCDLALCLFKAKLTHAGPIVGGFLGQAEGWRWVEGLMAIFTGTLWIAVTFVVPETYAPVLLRKRADKLSQLTGKTYISKFDAHRPKKTVVGEFKVALSRPWILLFREPIVFLTAIYMAIIYGTLYMLFAAFPIVYQRGRGWSPGIGGLAFIGVAVGMTLAVIYTFFDNKRYVRARIASGGASVPEARLPPAILGSFLLPIGLFWFAWTNGPEIHWVVSIIASGFFAAGLVLVFLSLFNYLIDSYVVFAASVLAANSVLRSLFGAAFPLFTTRKLPALREEAQRIAMEGEGFCKIETDIRQKCTTTSASTGRAPSPPSWRWPACPSRCSSTSTARRSG